MVQVAKATLYPWTRVSSSLLLDSTTSKHQDARLPSLASSKIAGIAQALAKGPSNLNRGQPIPAISRQPKQSLFKPISVLFFVLQKSKPAQCCAVSGDTGTASIAERSSICVLARKLSTTTPRKPDFPKEGLRLECPYGKDSSTFHQEQLTCRAA